MLKSMVAFLFAIAVLASVTPAMSQHDCRSGCWAVPPIQPPIVDDQP